MVDSMNALLCYWFWQPITQIALEREMYSDPNILKHASSPPGMSKLEA
ncbi:hypothetical protein MTsDn5_26570 [Alteromonas gracilis]